MLPPQVLALARQQNKRVKVVGGGHSPSDIACTDGFMIHMGKMNRILKVLGALGSLPLLHPMPLHSRLQGGGGGSFSLRPHPLLASESQSDLPQFLVHCDHPHPRQGLPWTPSSLTSGLCAPLCPQRCLQVRPPKVDS